MTKDCDKKSSKKEKQKDWHVLEFFVPIKETHSSLEGVDIMQDYKNDFIRIFNKFRKKY